MITRTLISLTPQFLEILLKCPAKLAEKKGLIVSRIYSKSSVLHSHDDSLGLSIRVRKEYPPTKDS